MRSYPAFDKTIELEFRAFPGLLWLGAGFEVRVGGRVFRPRLNRLTFFGHPLTAFDLEHRGRRITGMVRGVGSPWSLTRTRYSLVVGMSELSRDTLPLRGWPLSCLMVGVLSILIVLAVLEAAARLFPEAAAWLHRFY